MLLHCNIMNIVHGGFAINFVDFEVRSSLPHLSRRDLLSTFQLVFNICWPPLYSSQTAVNVRGRELASERLSDLLHISKQVFKEILHRFPAGSSWKCIRCQRCQPLQVSGLASIEAIDPTIDFNTPRNKNTVLCHALNTHARAHSERVCDLVQQRRCFGSRTGISPNQV